MMRFNENCRFKKVEIYWYEFIYLGLILGTTIDKYTGKLDHSPLVVVEAELGQVWPFCCWYSTTMLIHRK